MLSGDTLAALGSQSVRGSECGEVPAEPVRGHGCTPASLQGAFFRARVVGALPALRPGDG